jgi:hypothetical protein
VDANKRVQALDELRDGLSQELDTTDDPDRKGALNVAIRALISAIDIQETLIAHEQGRPQKRMHRDLDSYDQREEYLKKIMSPIEPTE